MMFRGGVGGTRGNQTTFPDLRTRKPHLEKAPRLATPGAMTAGAPAAAAAADEEICKADIAAAAF